MKVKQLISGGDTRCVQAAFRMVVLALVGYNPDADTADRMTGYVEGRGTWQFRMLLALAQYGLNVIDHEEFDVHGFISDPKSAIYKQVSDQESALAIINETDIEAEREAIRKCIESPRIEFIESVPTFSDLRSEVEKKRLVMVNVNKKVLQGEDGREGHILIIEHIEDESVVVHDPGPDGGLGVPIARDLFEKAWTSPSATMANYISVWLENQ